MVDRVDADVLKRALERVETELIPRLKSSKLRLRTVVAVNVLAIVDRQIGLGEDKLDEEWARLRGFVKDQPEALELVEGLEAAVRKYDADLRQKIEEAEADEQQLRKSSNAVIRMAIMNKLKALKASDEAAEAAAKADAAKSPDAKA